jgi:hypothetical protein
MSEQEIFLYEFLFLPYTVKDRIGYEFYCHTESEE